MTGERENKRERVRERERERERVGERETYMMRDQERTHTDLHSRFNESIQFPQFP